MKHAPTLTMKRRSCGALGGDGGGSGGFGLEGGAGGGVDGGFGGGLRIGAGSDDDASRGPQSIQSVPRPQSA
eukprot:7389176-Prymnesium_polylepis.2